MKKLLTILSLFFILSVPTNTFALSCMELPPASEAFEKADAVAVAKVIEVKEKNSKKQLKLEVLANHKGISQGEIMVSEDLTWGTSQLNETYLFYLNKEGNSYENPLCGSTTSDVDQVKEFGAAGGTKAAPEPPKKIEQDKEDSKGSDVKVDDVKKEIAPEKENTFKSIILDTDFQYGFIIGFTGVILLAIIILWYLRKKKEL